MPDGTANPTRINSQAASARKRRRSLGAMALEPRVMYDAAAVTTTANIWANTTHTIGNATAAATAVEKIAVDGTSAATAPVDVTDGATSGGELTQLAGIAVDTARQKFFVVDKDTSGNFVILSGSTVTGALDATPVYTLAGAGRGANISGLQINAQTGELYFTQSVPASSTGTSQTGIFMVSESATNLTQADIVANVAPGDTTHVGQVVSLAAGDTPKNLALDFQDNLVFFTESSGQGSGIDEIGIASLSGGQATFFQSTSIPGVAVNTNNGQLLGIAVDPSRDMLYFTTEDLSHQDQNYVFSAHFTVSGSGSSATATLDTSTITHLTLGANGAPTAITLDVPDGLFYITNFTSAPDGIIGPTGQPFRPSGNVQVGSLDQAGNVVSSQTLTTVFDASTLQVGLTNPVNLFIETTPTVTAGNSATFTQNGPAVTADAGLAAVDSSGQDLAGATVTISGGAFAGDTLTADITGTNIAWSYDSTNHTLTLSGADTAANYQRVLESVTYSSTNADPTNGGTDAQRTLSWTVSDGLLTSNTATSTVEIHRAPIVSAGDTATFVGGGAPVTLDGTLTVSDPDGSGNLASATVSIGSGFVAGDTLNFADQNGITGNYNAATGALTLSGTASVAAYQAALDSITYSFNPANGDPTAGGGDTSRTITWTVNNGAAPSNAVTSTLDAVHVAPSVAASGTTATFIAGSAPVTLDSGLTVGDVDSSNNLIGATVTISGGFLAGDTLNVNTSGTSIAASYDAATGTLTLSGNDTPAHYQQVLDTVAFGSSSADPTNNGTDTQRTLTWTVDDGVMTSSAATSATVHTPPSIATNGDPTFIAGGSPVTLDGSLTVSDVDSTTLATATVTISSGFLQGDTLAANTSGTTITAAYDPTTGTLTLSGSDTVAHYQQVLDSVVFSSTQADPTSGGINTQRNLTWSVSDTLSSATAASTVTVHTPPSISAGGTVTFVGGGQPVPLDGTVSVSDVDSATLSTATVKISSGFITGDALNFTNQNGITGSYDAVHGVLTLSGTTTLANYQKALESITYSFAAGGDPTQGGNTTRTVSWSVNDGVADSVSATSTVSTVNAVHTPPTVTGAGNTTPYSKQGPAAVVDGALTLSDPDSGGMLTGATVTISSGFLSGDTLAAVTTNTGITASYDVSTGVLTLTGQDTIAHYQSVLDSVTYSSTNNNPSQGNKDTTRTITWVVNDGATSNNLSTPVTSTIDITPGQSVVHAPHGNNAPAVVTSSAAAPTLSASTPVTYVVATSQSSDGDDRDAAPAWTATQSRGERDDHAAVDLRHAVVATDAELLAAGRGQAGGDGRHLGEGDKPAHGKPGLLAQLKAAGRHGLVHERQALIKDLHKRSAAR